MPSKTCAQIGHFKGENTGRFVHFGDKKPGRFVVPYSRTHHPFDDEFWVVATGRDECVPYPRKLPVRLQLPRKGEQGGDARPADVQRVRGLLPVRWVGYGVWVRWGVVCG